MYFGIGWHKTGTTSLTESFNLLGLKARHHPYEMYAEYASGAKQFESFGDNDFVCDAIIHTIYPELDRNYPDSKFILTRRPVDKWLSSVQQHFAKGHAPREDLGGQSWWDYNDEARHVHGIHEMMYGQRTFDAQTMASRYIRHEAETRAYFQNRPDDLLIVDIEDKNSFAWPRLCAFLGLPVHEGSIPHLRKSGESEKYFSFGNTGISAFIPS